MVAGRLDIDGLAAVHRPRRRRLLSIIAVVVPVFGIVAGAAWFVRAYIAPPTMTFPEPMMLASVQASAMPEALTETIGNSSLRWPDPVAPVVAPPPAAVSAWPVTRPPEAPVAETALVVAAREPLAGPIPLPLIRPRISSAIVRGPVPLPRERPVVEPN